LFHVSSSYQLPAPASSYRSSPAASPGFASHDHLGVHDVARGDAAARRSVTPAMLRAVSVNASSCFTSMTSVLPLRRAS
jgi:hypothetical protein